MVKGSFTSRSTSFLRGGECERERRYGVARGCNGEGESPRGLDVFPSEYAPPILLPPLQPIDPVDAVKRSVRRGVFPLATNFLLGGIRRLIV